MTELVLSLTTVAGNPSYVVLGEDVVELTDGVVGEDVAGLSVEDVELSIGVFCEDVVGVTDGVVGMDVVGLSDKVVGEMTVVWLED